MGTVSYLFDGFELYDPVYEVCVDNITVCTVYKRSHNKIESANLKWDQGQLQYDLNGIFWEMSSNEDGVYLTGQLHEVQQGNRVGIQSDCGVLPAIVEISLDGRSWIPFSSQTALLRDGTRMQINLDAGKISQIRLVFDKIAFDIEKSWNIHVGVYQENEYIDTWRDKPLDIGGAVATKGVGAEGYAYDGNISTRWDASQKPGVSYTLELTKVYELAGITVDYGEYRDDYPRKLSFYGSMDGENWFSISAEDCGGGYFRLMPQKVRYLQMVLEEESEWNWSICEIKCWITP